MFSNSSSSNFCQIFLKVYIYICIHSIHIHIYIYICMFLLFLLKSSTKNSGTRGPTYQSPGITAFQAMGT